MARNLLCWSLRQKQHLPWRVLYDCNVILKWKENIKFAAECSLDASEGEAVRMTRASFLFWRSSFCFFRLDLQEEVLDSIMLWELRVFFSCFWWKGVEEPSGLYRTDLHLFVCFEWYKESKCHDISEITLFLLAAQSLLHAASLASD